MKEQRIKQIEEYLRIHETCHLDELCEIFQVSKVTIRRDIDKLCELGIATKVYGGIKLAQGSVKRPKSFKQREDKQVDAKEYIAKLAATLIGDRDTIFIDSGTTASKIVQYLDNKRVYVITNNVNVIESCREKENISVISLGGEVLKVTNSIIGDMAISNLSSLNITTAFIGPTGASIEAGLSNTFSTEANIKKLAISKALNSYAVLDSSKWDVRAAITFCPLEGVTGIITEEKPPEKYTEFFKEHNIELHY